MVLNERVSRNKQNNRKSAGDEAGRPASERETKPGLEARAAAAKLLAAVVDRRTSLDGMLDAEGGNPAYKALSAADQALVRAILTTALRHLPRIDAALSMLIEKPLPEGARSLYHLLAVGAAQILYLDIPDHSAVDIAVELATRDPRSRRFAKLANAVLRNMSRQKAHILQETADVSVIPDWFMERLVADYGPETAQAIAESHNQPAAIDLTVKSDPEGWAERLGGQVLVTGSVRLDAAAGFIPDLPGFAEGEWWVQDAAASIPARLLGDIRGRRVADLCAAPGGKTAQLILAGAEVTAIEKSRSRLSRLRANLDRLGLSAELVEADAADYQPEVPFDAVLLDAPCSSTGTARRHPDVFWTKTEADIEKLAGVQQRLLRHAAGLIRIKGTIVFSNCSLDKAEGERMIEKILSELNHLERVPIQAQDWPDFAHLISDKGEIRTTPDMQVSAKGNAFGLDGFFTCILKRRA
ncbi:RsmB/NOP family class I SAM-dependent RNA methyltransferase [Rhizobium sp. NRK18]|uniref:RsmB/NOP family class I SAM-dependent RNA methyltransferase n=1 Tax=Rhizobium sp. NRK18 TaxID=2964667 RepID=UPI003965AB25